LASERLEAATAKGSPEPGKDLNVLYIDQSKTTPEDFSLLCEHIFGDAGGWLVTFTATQARLVFSDARQNELCNIEQHSHQYPDATHEAAQYLLAQARDGRDCYFGVHLFREAGNRRSTNAVGAMTCLWLDEDEGHYPEIGPEPTAIVHSSECRRHLYWRLTRPQPAEWVVAMNRRIAVWAGGDVGKGGLVSVLRVPGTRNFKRHPKVDPVRLEVTGVPGGAWEPETLEQAIPPLPEPERNPLTLRGHYEGPEVEILGYLEGVGAEILFEALDDGGRKFAIVCPWIFEHSGQDRSGTYIGQYADGALWFRCHHQHCGGRGWREFRRATRPTVGGFVVLNLPNRSDSTRKVVIPLD
jgi:hypothetical protein